MKAIYKRSIQLPEEEFELLNQIFGCRYKLEGVNSIKTRLVNDYYISNILKILLQTYKGKLRYQELYRKSRISSEYSFLRYLRWLIRTGLLEKKDMHYVITEKGMKIVDAFR